MKSPIKEIVSECLAPRSIDVTGIRLKRIGCGYASTACNGSLAVVACAARAALWRLAGTGNPRWPRNVLWL
jgi:hypothetical protein